MMRRIHRVLMLTLLAQINLVSGDISTNFLSVEEAYDYLELSNAIYSVEDESYDLPGDYRMLLFDEFVTNDRAMVVVSESKQIVAAVFCGTDNVNDWLHDLQIKMKAFGPDDEPINENVLVHTGFNDVLFNDGHNPESLYDRVKSTIEEFLKSSSDYTNYDVITCGHSLGGAVSVLAAAGLSDSWSKVDSSSILYQRSVTSATFGTPLVGDSSFKSWVEGTRGMNIGIWRHVLLSDVVARIPAENVGYLHSGHTLWFQDASTGGCRTYYGHYGDDTLSYISVPDSYYARPLSIDDHSLSNYMEYMESFSLVNPDLGYSNSFESNEIGDGYKIRGHFLHSSNDVVTQ